ncbi:MAG: hypothetical protein KAU01_04245 [Candidatus Cloacimonetes bacterium]|nr:hypothetical protein [Candidatus Cloacimonadota bacterium]
MNKLEDLIDINKQKGLPRVYRFNQFMRWFTLTFGVLAIAYSFWLIFTKIGVDSSKFYKFVPFAIMFLAANSVFKNLLTLNSILFTKEKIAFRYLARKSIKIYWNALKRMELNDAKRKMIRLKYSDNDKEKVFEFTINFPNMLEIVNSIAEMCPDILFDEFIEKVIISDKEKLRNRKNT